MTNANAKKLLIENPLTKPKVQKILAELDGLSFSECETILKLSAHFLKENTFLDSAGVVYADEDGEG